MSNRLYPNWEQLDNMHNPLTDGERSLLKYLDTYLPRDENWQEGGNLSDYCGWLIFAQPYLNGKRPDVVIFNPHVGVVIYEVKDWNLANYKYDANSNKFYFCGTNNEEHEKKSPRKQAEYYKEVLIGQLVPLIGESVDANEKNFGLIKTGVYFHNALTDQCRNMFYPDNKYARARKKPYEYSPCFGRDTLGLGKAGLNEVVPDVRRKKSSFWDTAWNDDILFWLKPPFHSLEQCTKLKLKGNQQKIVEPQAGHFRIRGVAGSGKTQALAYRAAKLASLGKSVLVLSFNITLWHYIKDMIARAPFEFKWERIRFDHFHGFCHDILNQAGIKWPDGSGDDFFTKIIPENVINALKQIPNHERYDAILIDEGQDYVFEWYSLLNKFFLSQHDELVVVCDKRQNIYERDLNWLDKRITRAGLEKFGDYIDLTVSIRQPPRLAAFSKDFADSFELRSDISQVPNPEASFVFERIIWKEIAPSYESVTRYAIAAFKKLKNSGESASDIIFLVSNVKVGLALVEQFKSLNIEVNHVFEDAEADSKTHKRAFWMGDGRLKICTIHSFKGWELQNVVLVIPPYEEDEHVSLDSLIYTALTRVKHNIIVLNQNKKYSSFGAKYPSGWDQNAC